MKSSPVGELWQKLVDEWGVIITNVSNTRIEAQEFQNDKNADGIRTLDKLTLQ